MQKLQIPINETSVAMGRGVLHLLTILPHGQIDLYGIDHVANKLEAELEQHNNDHGEDKWEVFGSISVVRELKFIYRAMECLRNQPPTH
ncbi:hypothetical protein F444_12353 [Phytophthora nicotianae P1976]|uniref:Uncharacterized protein n=1 Tax=Phytophthora nicotianae P1976 TaxID=1317066 RepID=A0A080ZXC1_PHYNI|nr:hypothetical protein F444_12353 [Phytophthora nicotianae P1976]